MYGIRQIKNGERRSESHANSECKRSCGFFACNAWKKRHILLAVSVRRSSVVTVVTMVTTVTEATVAVGKVTVASIKTRVTKVITANTVNTTVVTKATVVI